ncbi:hypothetical protein UlMin_019566 [Ulmus minor]
MWIMALRVHSHRSSVLCKISSKPFSFEYGGGAFRVSRETVIFSNYKDQRLYKQLLNSKDSSPTPLTPYYGGLVVSYADGVFDSGFNHFIIVQEDRRKCTNSTTTIVTMSLGSDNIQEPEVLVVGNDFHAFSHLDPKGERMAWIEWSHPNMPWDKAELWVGYISDKGCSVPILFSKTYTPIYFPIAIILCYKLFLITQVLYSTSSSLFVALACTLYLVTNTEGLIFIFHSLIGLIFSTLLYKEIYKLICVAGSYPTIAESPIEPKWSSDGELFFISDKESGFWNLHKWVESETKVVPVYSLDAKFFGPLWVFGINSYEIIHQSQGGKCLIAFTYRQNGRSYLGILDDAQHTMSLLDVPFTDINNIRSYERFLRLCIYFHISAEHCLYVEGASASQPSFIAKVTLDDHKSKVVDFKIIWSSSPDWHGNTITPLSLTLQKVLLYNFDNTFSITFYSLGCWIYIYILDYEKRVTKSTGHTIKGEMLTLQKDLWYVFDNTHNECFSVFRRVLKFERKHIPKQSIYYLRHLLDQTKWLYEDFFSLQPLPSLNLYNLTKTDILLTANSQNIYYKQLITEIVW